MVEIRWFAGAAEAAGRASESREADPGASVADVLAAAAAGNDRLVRVLEVSTVLLDGARSPDTAAPLPPGDHAVDVLPPFAGG